MTEVWVGMTEVWAVVGGGSGLCAAKGVGFGPQIEFGATERWARRGLEAVWGLGAALVEIPAAERGYDGGGGAGMTEVWASVTEGGVGLAEWG